jgi:hypothetical protein
MKKTPSNNMGSEITDSVKAPSENRVLIDWLSWTLKVVDPLDAIEKSGLGRLPFKQAKCGAMG